MDLKFKFLEGLEEEKKETLPEKVTPYPVLDLEEAKKTFAGYLEVIDNMLATAKDLVINNDKTNVDATILGTSAMSLHKKIMAQKEATQSYVEAKEFVDKFEAFVIMLTEKLYSTSKKKETIVSITKDKISQYKVVLESDRRKQQELTDKATVELQGKLDKEAEKTGTVAPKVEPQIIPKKESVVRTESGASYTKKIWTFKVNDPEWHIKAIEKMMDELFKTTPDMTILYALFKDLAEVTPFLILNETKLRRAVNDGRKHIGSLGDEGTAIHIYEKVDTSFRTA
jgi:hypothetical protein